MRLLLLGGTAEARELAARLHPRIDIVSSLAGRVPDPALPVGPVRVGGFGGVAGLREWLSDNDIDVVIDATHPFAATITAHAATACADLGLAHLVLHRPAWEVPGALEVGSDTEAADLVSRNGYTRIFLTTGRSGVSAFRTSGAWFLIRVVTAPEPDTLPRDHQLVFSRGPYRYEDERALMAQHGIAAVVTKNSGGAMTHAKIQAAQDLGIDVVLIQRPALPPGVATADSVGDAQEWVFSRDSGAG